MSDGVLQYRVDSEGLAKDFRDLVWRCYNEDPDQEDIKALRKQLKEMPELYHWVFDLGDAARNAIIDKSIKQDAPKIAIEANVEILQEGMFYDESSMLERLLIDNVINCWLRYQWVELQYARSNSDWYETDFWEKRLSANQRRYLRACETLARIRKLTGSTYQVNIAQDGGQQINVAGDLVK